MEYWDTSSLVKLYAPEFDSERFIRRVEQQSVLCTSSVALTELPVSLLRKAHEKVLSPRDADSLIRSFREDCAGGRIELVPYHSRVALEAERIVRLALNATPPRMVRSLDLIHAASALSMDADTFVATDTRLKDIIRLLGIRLFPE